MPDWQKATAFSSYTRSMRNILPTVKNLNLPGEPDALIAHGCAVLEIVLKRSAALALRQRGLGASRPIKGRHSRLIQRWTRRLGGLVAHTPCRNAVDARHDQGWRIVDARHRQSGELRAMMKAIDQPAVAIQNMN